MAGKDAAYKEQSRSRRDTNQFKKQSKRKQKQERSQSEFMPHGNQYRRKRQQDREESYNEDLDLYDYFEEL
jgi:hypothetical protein